MLVIVSSSTLVLFVYKILIKVATFSFCGYGITYWKKNAESNQELKIIHLGKKADIYHIKYGRHRDRLRERGVKLWMAHLEKQVCSTLALFFSLV